MKFLKYFFEPIKFIKDQPFQFIVWVIVAIILGLTGFWLPLISVTLVGQGSSFENQIKVGTLMSFNIVILADGLALFLTAVNAGRSTTTAGIRGLMGIFALILILLSGFFLAFSVLVKEIDQKFVISQICLTVLSIVLACYLYCFRSSEWEKTVDEHKKKEDQEVEDLSNRSRGKSQDDEGTKL